MGGEIPPFQKESKMSENISFLKMSEILSPISNDVEKLKDGVRKFANGNGSTH